MKRAVTELSAPLLSVRDLIKLYGLSAKQQLSQNFILDKNITDKLVAQCGSFANSVALEVGPGPGLLTRSIIDANPLGVIVVEKDRRFLPSLEMLRDATNGKVKIISGDVLQLDNDKVLSMAEDFLSPAGLTLNPKEKIGTLKLVGNLPFGVATPLLIQWLRATANKTGLMKAPKVDMSLMFQKEVAMRMVAKEDTKERSRLSVFTQRICDVKCVYDVPSTAFVPPPKVVGTFVTLVPREKPLFEANNEALEEVLRIAFNTRRKMIRNSFRAKGEKAVEVVSKAGFDPRLRAEDLTIEQFCHLTNLMVQEGVIVPHEISSDSPRDYEK